MPAVLYFIYTLKVEVIINSSLLMCLGVQGQDPQRLRQCKCQIEKGKKANRQAGITPQPLLTAILLFADDIQQGILPHILQDT